MVYLRTKLGDFGVNVDTYSSTMEHMGMISFKIYPINAGNAKCKIWYMCIYTAGLLEAIVV
jgi:hypothetical protein